MRDPYEVLGILPGAPDGEVKRAFRRLAKQLHPDLHPNDASADQRFREVASAYQALLAAQSHPAAHSRNGAPGRSSRPWGFQAGATTVFVFLLTVGSASLVVLWPELGHGPSPTPQIQEQPLAIQEGASLPVAEPPEVTIATVLRPHGESTGAESPVAPAGPPKQPPSGDQALAHSRLEQELSQQDLGKAIDEHTDAVGSGRINEARPSTPHRRGADALTNAADLRVAPKKASRGPSLAPPGSVDELAWTTLRNVRFSFSLAYPADIFVADPAQANQAGDELAFRSRDGRAQLIVSAGMNSDGTPLAAYRRSLMTGRYGSAAIDYAPRRAHWFVLSGVLGDEIFYERVTLSCDKRMVHSWKLAYPLAERALYDRIVEEVHRRYRHGNGPGGHCRETSEQATRATRPDAQKALSR
jgi:hypothetical protein